MRTALSWILPAFFTLAGGPAWARSPERITFPVSVTWDVGLGNNVYLVGNHPDVGSWNPVNAHKLRWTTGNNWTGQVAVQAGTALEYKFISRNGASNQFCNGANVVWEGGANRTTNLPAAASAPFTGKTIFYYSSWTSATLVTASSNAYPFARVGPGRTGGEYLHRVDGVPEEGEPLEFAINGSLGGVSGWDKPPPGDGWGVNGNYYTTLDVFLIQEGQIYNYWPSNTVSAPSSETRVVSSSYSAITGRTIRIYLPRGYTNHLWKRYPVIYMQDGQNMADPANPGGSGSWQFDATAARETRQGRMRETIVVGIDNIPHYRRTEYNPNGDTYPGEVSGLAWDYLRFLVDNVRPTLDTHYRTLNDSRNTLVGGSSMGGIFSLYAGFETNVFGGVLAMSPAVTRAPNYKAALPGKPKRPLRIYIDTGTDEGGVGPPEHPLGYYWDDPWSAFDSAMIIGYAPGDNLMLRIGCGHVHNEAAWRARLPDAVRFLLNVRDEPNLLALEQHPPRLTSLGAAGASAFTTYQHMLYQWQRSSLDPAGPAWTDEGIAQREAKPWGHMVVTGSLATAMGFWRVLAQPAP
jgi:predicted alpha/beta superfamily hydrolase